MAFRSLVPPVYRRGEAPRLTASGGTLHGMHKGMSLSVLQEVSKKIGGSFVDMDLSACYANVACATQRQPHSELYKLVNNVEGNFWSDTNLLLNLKNNLILNR